MRFFSANLDSLRKLYLNQLQMMLSAEQQIDKALPAMIEKATDAQLKQALDSHRLETKQHVIRLQTIVDGITGESMYMPIKCKVLAALITEAEDMMTDATDDSVRDVAIIAAAQRVEHYEIAAYGALRTWAHILGENSHAEILDKTIKEEGHADHTLTEISNRVNPNAERAA